MSDRVHHWRLYGTLGCHLCEQAEQIVAILAKDFTITLEIVDITDDASWLEAFAERIPVLENFSNGQVANWPFDPHILSDWLNEPSAQ